MDSPTAIAGDIVVRSSTEADVPAMVEIDTHHISHAMATFGLVLALGQRDGRMRHSRSSYDLPDRALGRVRRDLPARSWVMSELEARGSKEHERHRVARSQQRR